MHNDHLYWAAYWPMAHLTPLLKHHSQESRQALALELLDQPKPHWIQSTESMSTDTRSLHKWEPFKSMPPRHVRIARVDLRVGTAHLDNTNFQTFGSQDGLTIKRLPTSDNVLALRRELWLALDSTKGCDRTMFH